MRDVRRVTIQVGENRLSVGAGPHDGVHVVEDYRGNEARAPFVVRTATGALHLGVPISEQDDFKITVVASHQAGTTS